MLGVQEMTEVVIVGVSIYLFRFDLLFFGQGGNSDNSISDPNVEGGMLAFQTCIKWQGFKTNMFDWFLSETTFPATNISIHTLLGQVGVNRTTPRLDTNRASGSSIRHRPLIEFFL